MSTSSTSAFDDGGYVFASSIQWVAANVFIVSLSPPFSRTISCELSAADVPRTANAELNNTMRYAAHIVNSCAHIVLRQDFYSRYPLEGYGDILFLPPDLNTIVVDSLPGTLLHPGVWTHCSDAELRRAGWRSLQEELIRAGAARMIRPVAIGVDALLAAEEEVSGSTSSSLSPFSSQGLFAECKCSWGKTMATWEKSVRMSQTWVGTVVDVLRGDALCIQWDTSCSMGTPTSLRTEFQPSLVLLDGVRCEAIGTTLGYSAVRAVQRVAFQRRVRVQVRSVHPADKDIANNTQMTEFELLAHVRGCVELLPIGEASSDADAHAVTGDIGRWLLRQQLGKMQPVSHASLPRCHTFFALIRDVKANTEEANPGGSDGSPRSPLSLLEVWRRFLWGGDVLDNRLLTLPETHVHHPLHFLHSLKLPLLSAGVCVGFARSASLEISAAPLHAGQVYRRFLRMEIELLLERQRTFNAGRRDRHMSRGMGEVVFTPEPTSVRYGTALTVSATYSPQLSGMKESSAHIALTSTIFRAGLFNPSQHTPAPPRTETNVLLISIPSDISEADVVVDAIVKFEDSNEMLTSRAVYRVLRQQVDLSSTTSGIEEEINMDAEMVNVLTERGGDEDGPVKDTGKDAENSDGDSEGEGNAPNEAEGVSDPLLGDVPYAFEEAQHVAQDTSFFHSLVDFYFELPPYEATGADVRRGQIHYSVEREPWLADLMKRVRALQYADVCVVPAGVITFNNRRGYIGDLLFVDRSAVTQRCSAAVAGVSSDAEKIPQWGYPWEFISSFDQAIRPLPTNLPLTSFVHDIGRGWWRTSGANSQQDFLSSGDEALPLHLSSSAEDPEAPQGVDVQRALVARASAMLLLVQKEEATVRSRIEAEEVTEKQENMRSECAHFVVGGKSTSDVRGAEAANDREEITVAPWWMVVRIGKEQLWIDSDSTIATSDPHSSQTKTAASRQVSAPSPYLAFASSSIPQNIPLFAFSIFPRQFFSAHFTSHYKVVNESQADPVRTPQYTLQHVDAAFMRLRFSQLPNFFAMNLERLPLTLYNSERAYCGYAQRVEFQKQLHRSGPASRGDIARNAPTAAGEGHGTDSRNSPLYASESVLARLLCMLLRLSPKRDMDAKVGVFDTLKSQFKVSDSASLAEVVLYRLTDSPPRTFFLGTRDSFLTELFEEDQALCTKLPPNVTGMVISQLGVETLFEGNCGPDVSSQGETQPIPFSSVPLTHNVSPDCIPMGKLNFVAKVASSSQSSSDDVRPHILDRSSVRRVVYHPLPWLSVIGDPLAVRDEVDRTVPHSPNPDAELPLARRHIGVKCIVLRIPKSRTYQMFSYGQAARRDVFDVQEKLTHNGTDITDYFSLLLRRPSSAMRDAPFPDGLMRVYTVPMEPLYMSYIPRRALRFQAALFWDILRTDADIPQVEKYVPLVPFKTKGSSPEPAQPTTLNSHAEPSVKAEWYAEDDDEETQDSAEYLRDLAYVQGGAQLGSQYESTYERAVSRAREALDADAATKIETNQGTAGAISLSDAKEADVLVRLCRVARRLIRTIAAKLYPDEGEIQPTSADKPAAKFPYAAFDRCFMGCHFSVLGGVARLMISLYPVPNDPETDARFAKGSGGRFGDAPSGTTFTGTSDEKELRNPHRFFSKNNIVYGRMWAHQLEVKFSGNQYVWRWLD